MTNPWVSCAPGRQSSGADIEAAAKKVEAAADAVTMLAGDLISAASSDESETTIPVVGDGPELSPCPSEEFSFAGKLLAVRAKDGRSF